MRLKLSFDRPSHLQQEVFQMRNRNFLATSFAAFAMVCGLSLSANAQLVDIVNDSFTDGDRAVTGMSGSDLEAGFFNTSSSAGIESNAATVGLVSGTSGRQIHAYFPTQTLNSAGDTIISSLTFTTPGFVASNATQAEFDAANAAQGGGASIGTIPAGGDDLKIGLFQSVPGLNADITASTGTPNPLLSGLAGYHVELDVEPTTVTNQDLDLRRSDPSTTGRLLATNTGTPSIGSGPDIGYVFQPNTQYTLIQSIMRNAASGLDFEVSFFEAGVQLGSTLLNTDAAPNAFDFGILAIGASSEAFGVSNDAGVADNGIDINNLTIQVDIAETTVVPEPSALALLGLMGCAGLMRRRR